MSNQTKTPVAATEKLDAKKIGNFLLNNALIIIMLQNRKN